jgi:general secretion pathway protein F/type IV pilus assembly protein PilC
MFLMIVGLGIVTVMMIFFVPEFASMFERMEDQGTLPWATTTLLAISDLIQQRGALLALAAAGVIAGIIWYFGTPEGARNLDRLKLRLPGLGGILQSLAVARFCRMLGTLLKNGVPILQSLRIAKDASGNVILSEAIGNAAENVSSGQSLAVPLRACGQFSRDLIEMIAVGEEANNLENVLINVADNLEKRTSRKIDMVVRLLEPMLLLVMATIVTFVIAALLLPVLNMSANR